MVSDPKPAVCLIHGAWHCPEHYVALISTLKSRGYHVIAPLLASVQDAGGPNHYVTVQDDAEAVRKELIPIIEEGKSVVVVGHSYGGHVMSEAVKDLSIESRKKSGLEGGVIRLFYMCAFMLPEKTSISSAVGWTFAPFAPTPGLDGRSYADGELPVSLFYSEVPAEERQSLAKHLRVHSASAHMSCTTYAGWRDIPTTYLVCEADPLINPQLQQTMIENTRKAITVEKCSAGHSPFLVQPGFVADAIERSAVETC